MNSEGPPSIPINNNLEGGSRVMKSIDLTENVAVVTGASRGIGLATAEALLQAGSRVVLNSREGSDATRAVFARLAAEHPGQTSVVFGSVADSATATAIGQHVMSKYKRLDVLVNNAGILRDRLIGMIPDSEIEEVFDVNVFGSLRLIQVAARIMTRRKSGSIVNVASIVGQRGNKGEMVYAASKAALIGATYAAAKELAPLNIRVNAVAPGLIETALLEHVPENDRTRIQASIALGRIGSPAEVANAILFLASDLSAYVTGQVLGVDGGLVI
jgi:3-oxoacyl-[acyl-carrier protein] reductase